MDSNDDIIEKLLAEEALRRLNASGTIPIAAPGPPETMEKDTRAIWAACEQRLFDAGTGGILAPWTARGCEMCSGARVNCTQTSTISFYGRDIGNKNEGLWVSDSSTHRSHWSDVTLVELAANQHVLMVLEKHSGILGVKSSLQSAALAAGARVAAATTKSTATPAVDGAGGVSWGKIGK